MGPAMVGISIAEGAFELICRDKRIGAIRYLDRATVADNTASSKETDGKVNLTTVGVAAKW